jgi:hypothetical protein
MNTDKKKTNEDKNQQSKSKEVVKKELTEEEKARIEEYRQRAKAKPPKLKKTKAEPGTMATGFQDPEDDLLCAKVSEALGTADPDLLTHLLDQVIKSFKGVVSADGLDEDKGVEAANRAMAILTGIQPRDEIESMLAVQMIGVHNMAMETMGRAMLGGQTFEGRQCNVNFATKMLRTFIAQVETLKRYRGGGEQKMIVEHVHVNEGGQAVVGTVNTRGRENSQSRE